MIAERRTFALGLIAASVTVLSLIAGCGQPPVAVGGPFRLTDQNGRTRDQSILKGKWSAVFFGYTYCPDVCPTTLQTLADAQDRLGANGKRFQVVFITVDPARDTPAQLKTYLSSPAFPKGAIGLTGTEAQVAAAAKAYHVFYQKQGSGSGYEVQHSSVVYLMDPHGQFNSVVTPGQPPDAVARQIADKMNG
jgi:protein SCO1/2